MKAFGQHDDVSPIRNPCTGLNADIQGASRWAGAKLIGWYPNSGDNQFFGSYQLS